MNFSSLDVKTDTACPAALRFEEIRVKNVKAIDHLVLKIQPTGVTVIYGENESGKSTVIEAVQTLLADNPLTSKKAQIKALKPMSKDEHPEIQATMQIGPYHLTFRRLYASSSSKAELAIDSPRVENVTGSEAINRFQQILSEYSDEELRHALSIRQGDILHVEELFKKKALSQAIGRASVANGEEQGQSKHVGMDGVDTGAPHIADVVMDAGTQQLVASVREVRERYFTPKSVDKKTAVFQSQWDQLERANKDLESARQRMDQAQEHSGVIERSGVVIRQLAEDTQVKQQRLLELEAQQELAEQQAQKLVALRQQVETAAEAEQRVEHEQHRRQRLVEDVDTLTAQLEVLEARVQEQLQSVDKEQRRVDDQRKQKLHDQLELNLAQALQEMVWERQQKKQVDQQAQSLESAIDKAKDLEEQRVQLSNALAENLVTAEAMSKISEQAQQYAVCCARRDAAATTVKVEGPEGSPIGDGGATITLGESAWQTQVVAPRTLTLGEYQITVSPAGQAENLDDAVDFAHRQLIATLEKYKVAVEQVASQDHTEHTAEYTAEQAANQAVERAREQAAQRARLSQSLDDVMTALRALVGTETVQQRVQELEKLKQASDSHSHTLERTTQRVKDEYQAYESGVDHPNLLLDELLHKEVIDQRWITELRTRVNTGEDQEDNPLEAAKQRATAIQMELATARSTATLRRKDLLAARESMTDEALEEQLKEAIAKKQAAYDKQQEMEKSLQGANSPEMIASKIEGLRTALRSNDHQVRQQEHNIAIARHEIEQAGGTAEDVQTAEAEVNRLSASLHAADKQAKAANLLVSLFDQAHDAMMEKYQAPFLTELTRLAKNVFGPDVSFDLSSDLAVTKRITGGEAITLDQLSGGATEQIAVLYRLAAASVMGKGDSVPIFLDDTLGYTDQFRAENMNAVLAMMGREHQLIVTTCDPRRFSSIAGATTCAIDELKQRPLEASIE